MEKNFVHFIQERHSIREYDPSYKISKEELESILEVATSAPSSRNLQPWRFVVITDENVKQEVKEMAFNQQVFDSCSAVIAVIGDCEMYRNAEHIYQSNVEAGNMPEELKQEKVAAIENMLPNLSLQVRENIALFDAGLVSMQIMLVARAYGYDTVTIGGFNKDKFAKRFELTDRYVPIVLIPIGKAAAPAFKTTRLPINEITTFIS